MVHRLNAQLVLTLVLLVTVVWAVAVPASASESANESVAYNVIVLPVFADDEAPAASVGTIMDRMEYVGQYFSEASYGKVSFVSTIIGWVKLPELMASYPANTTYQNGVEHVTADSKLIRDALNIIEPALDFTKYDALVVLHAGKSNQMTHSVKDIGTCYIPVTFWADGHAYDGACVVSESDTAEVVAHELSHWLDAPDLYDYRGQDPSISDWCLMGTGDSGMCAFTKLHLGFIQDLEVFHFDGGRYQLSLSPLSWEHKEYRVLKYDLPDGRYLLVEARDNRIGLDVDLRSRGILITIINETTIENLNGGAQVQLPEGTSSLENATFVPGEVYTNDVLGIHVQVVEWSDEGLVLDVSSGSKDDWVEVERIQYADDRTVDYVDLLYVNASSPFYLASMGITQGGWHTMQLYRTQDHGRTWILLYDSFGHFNVSRFDSHAICWHDNQAILVNRVQKDGRWFDATVFFYTDFISILDLESLTLVNETLLSSFDAASDGENLYMAFISSAEGHPGVTYLTLNSDGWKHARIDTECAEIALSNCINKDQPPQVWLRNSTGLYTGDFNSTLSMVMPHGSWYIDAAYGASSFSAFLWQENDTNYLRALHGTVIDGFTDMILRPIVTVSKPSLCIADNVLYLLWLGDNLTLLEFSGSMINEFKTIEIGGQASVPKMDSRNWIHPLIVIFHGNTVSTLAFQATPQGPFQSTIWYMYTIPAAAPDLLPILVLLVAPVVVAVIVLYAVRPRQSER